MNVIRTGDDENTRKEIERRQPYAVAMEESGAQFVFEEMAKSMEAIHRHALGGKGYSTILKSCGLTAPTTPEEEYRVFYALKAVVGFCKTFRASFERLAKEHRNMVVVENERRTG